jgi:hypothetical protein
MNVQDASATPQPSTTPIGRSLGFERGLTVVLGLAALLAGLAALVVSTGALGKYRALRPVLDPLVVQAWRSAPRLAAALVLLLGIALFLIGVWWVFRSLHPEPRPDVLLENSPSGSLTVTSSALTEAIRSDAETVSGVRRARVRMAGSVQRPALRLTLALQEGTNVRLVWEELDAKVLSRARQALETEVVPTAIRLQLDRAPRQRVS